MEFDYPDFTTCIRNYANITYNKKNSHKLNLKTTSFLELDIAWKLHNHNYSIQKLRWNASIVRDLNPLFLTIVMPPTDIGMSLTNPILSDLAQDNLSE